jgi:vesicle coat complex subunit
MSRRKSYLLIAGLLLLGVAFYFTQHRPQSTEHLLGDLESKDEGDRIRAARLLPGRTEEAARIVPALIEALHDKEGDVRRSAALGLGSFGEQAKEAVPALQHSALRDRDTRVREAAVKALNRIDPAAVPKAASPGMRP